MTELTTYNKLSISSAVNNELIKIIKTRADHRNETTKIISVHIDGEIFPAIEYCVKLYKFHLDYIISDMYVEYVRNEKMEYLKYTKTIYKDDFPGDTEPPYYMSCKLYRFDKSKSQYITHWVYVYDDINDDNVREVGIAKTFDELHEYKMLLDEYNEFTKKRTKFYTDSMTFYDSEEEDEIEAYYDPETVSKILFIKNHIFNPYSGTYEYDISK